MTLVSRIAFVGLAGFLFLGCSTSADDGEPSGQSDDTPIDGDEFRRFNVDGAEVWVRSELPDIPRSASTIQITGMLIDSGDGPEICHGAVNDSYPPQCAGPVVVGLADGWWTETAGGVHWGERTVTITWPPVDDTVDLVSDQAPIPRRWPDHPTRLDLPRECASIEQFVDYQTLRNWETANPDRNSHVRVVEDATIAVLAVDDDLEAVRTELGDGDRQACVVPVGYSREELQGGQDDLNELFGTDVYLATTGGGNAYDRVTVEVLVADRDTVEKIVDAVEHPDMLLITGIAAIVDGT